MQFAIRSKSDVFDVNRANILKLALKWDDLQNKKIERKDGLGKRLEKPCSQKEVFSPIPPLFLDIFTGILRKKSSFMVLMFFLQKSNVF